MSKGKGSSESELESSTTPASTPTDPQPPPPPHDTPQNGVSTEASGVGVGVGVGVGGEKGASVVRDKGKGVQFDDGEGGEPAAPAGTVRPKVRRPLPLLNYSGPGLVMVDSQTYNVTGTVDYMGDDAPIPALWHDARPHKHSGRTFFKEILSIELPDGSTRKVAVETRTTAQEVMKRLTTKLGLKQSEYLGLLEYTEDGYESWLRLRESLLMQLKDKVPLVKLAFKLYPASLDDLYDECAVRLLYYQTQSEIVADVYGADVTQELVTELCALHIQSHFGDYTEGIHKSGYLKSPIGLSTMMPPRLLKKHRNKVWQDKVFALHPEFAGLSPLEAQLRYLHAASRLPGFGSEWFEVNTVGGTEPMNLILSPHGAVVKNPTTGDVVIAYAFLDVCRVLLERRGARNQKHYRVTCFTSSKDTEPLAVWTHNKTDAELIISIIEGYCHMLRAKVLEQARRAAEEAEAAEREAVESVDGGDGGAGVGGELSSSMTDDNEQHPKLSRGVAAGDGRRGSLSHSSQHSFSNLSASKRSGSNHSASSSSRGASSSERGPARAGDPAGLLSNNPEDGDGGDDVSPIPAPLLRPLAVDDVNEDSGGGSSDNLERLRSRLAGRNIAKRDSVSLMRRSAAARGNVLALLREREGEGEGEEGVGVGVGVGDSGTTEAAVAAMDAYAPPDGGDIDVDGVYLEIGEEEIHGACVSFSLVDGTETAAIEIEDTTTAREALRLYAVGVLGFEGEDDVVGLGLLERGTETDIDDRQLDAELPLLGQLVSPNNVVVLDVTTMVHDTAYVSVRPLLRHIYFLHVVGGVTCAEYLVGLDDACKLAAWEMQALLGDCEESEHRRFLHNPAELASFLPPTLRPRVDDEAAVDRVIDSIISSHMDLHGSAPAEAECAYLWYASNNVVGYGTAVYEAGGIVGDTQFVKIGLSKEAFTLFGGEDGSIPVGCFEFDRLINWYSGTRVDDVSGDSYHVISFSFENGIGHPSLKVEVICLSESVERCILASVVCLSEHSPDAAGGAGDDVAATPAVPGNAVAVAL